MAHDTVKQAIENLGRAIDEGDHNCSVHVEPLGDSTEVSFYLDGEEEEAVGMITVTPIQS